MLTDLDDHADDVLVDADICIIGAGAAGITVAREFIGTQYSVVVLEGGGRTIEPASQDPYSSDVTGHAHAGIHDGRARAFGGTTHLWAGQALPLFDIDFEARDWVPASGWPITRQDLKDFYRRAEQVMQIDHAEYNLTDWPSADAPNYDPSQLASLFSQFTREPNFAKKFGAELQQAQNIRVLLHANVTAIHVSGNADHANAVHAVSFKQRKVAVNAKFVILCAGGIESARCLLLSDAVEPHGIGNRHDVVGRYFQDHPTVNVAVAPRNRKRFAAWCNSFARNGIRYTLKMVPSDALMRSERILHVGAEVHYPPDENDGLAAAKMVLAALRDRDKRAQSLPSLGKVARDPFKVIAAAHWHYVRGQPASVGRTKPQLGFFCEQEPNPDSRVKLTGALDSLGMRRAALDWRFTGSEVAAVNVLGRAIEREWTRLDVASFDFSCLPTLGTADFSAFTDLNHHIGTCRMGSDPRVSVVDSECRVHGYDNLYIASSATFPTSGFSNPTLTALALSLRIADKLKIELSHGEMHGWRTAGHDTRRSTTESGVHDVSSGLRR